MLNLQVRINFTDSWGNIQFRAILKSGINIDYVIWNRKELNGGEMGKFYSNLFQDLIILVLILVSVLVPRMAISLFFFFCLKIWEFKGEKQSLTIVVFWHLVHILAHVIEI